MWDMACPDCGINVPKLEPRSFSFNSAFGACPECHGLGSLYDLDPAKVITVDATSGLVRLTAFPAGGTTTDKQNVSYDGTGTVSNTWRYPSTVSGL